MIKIEGWHSGNHKFKMKVWSPTSTTKVVPSNFKDENGDIQICRIKVELKEESGVIKITGLKLGYQIQGWKWGHMKVQRW